MQQLSQNASDRAKYHYLAGDAELRDNLAECGVYNKGSLGQSRSRMLKDASKYFNQDAPNPFVFEHTIAGFDNLVIANSVKPRHVVFVFHNRFKNPRDFLGLGQDLAREASASSFGVNIVVPYAPHIVGSSESLEWWSGDMSQNSATQSLRRIIKAGKRKLLRDAKFDDSEEDATGEFAPLTELTEFLNKLITEICDALELTYDQISVAGFGQGGAIAKELIFMAPAPPAVALLWSTSETSNYPGMEAHWTLISSNEKKYRSTTRILMSHGERDHIYNYKKAFQIYETFKKMGFRAKFLQHNLGFTIPPSIFTHSVQYWLSTVSSEPRPRPPAELYSVANSSFQSQFSNKQTKQGKHSGENLGANKPVTENRCLESVGYSVILGADAKYGALSKTELNYDGEAYDPMIEQNMMAIPTNVSLWNISKFNPDQVIDHDQAS